MMMKDKRKELSEVSFREYEKTPLINKVNRWEKSVQFDLQQIEELIDEAEKKMDIISTNEELENFTKENVKYTVLKLTIPDEDSNGCFLHQISQWQKGIFIHLNIFPELSFIFAGMSIKRYKQIDGSLYDDVYLRKEMADFIIQVKCKGTGQEKVALFIVNKEIKKLETKFKKPQLLMDNTKIEYNTRI